LEGEIAMADAPPSTRPGPLRRLHVRITPVDAKPDEAFIARCDTLQAMLVERDAGVIEPRTIACGAVNIFVATRYQAQTRAVVWRAAAELGLTDRVTIQEVGEGK
jgi:hypothetical protein